MKLRKQIKNRVMAVAMLAVVLFGGLSFVKPETAYAATYKDRDFLHSESYEYGYVRYDNTEYNLCKFNDSFNGQTVSFYRKTENFTNFLIGFISDKKFDSTMTQTNYYASNEEHADKNEFEVTKSQGKLDQFTFEYNGTTYYIASRSFSNYLKPVPCETYFGHLGVMYNITDENFVFSDSNNCGLLRDYVAKRIDPNICTMVSDGTSTDVSTDESTWPGNQDNPIPDENIGTLVIMKSKCYWVKDGSMDVSQRVQWANKTDTDFSLTNNKYAITRIEVKIGNRVTYFGDVEHHGTGKKVDNFGKVYPFKYVIATDNPHDFSFKDMLSASKTDLTKYNAAMLEHEYDLYFRVVCGTAYGTSAEWHCGNWTRYRVTDDPKQDGKNESDNGHFNDNGEWEKDKDTDVDSGGIGNVDDKDDLEDDFNHFKDSENWKDWLNKEGLDLDSAKAFINQIADVPKMIGDLFSFFPDWVKYSFALGFGLIPIIIVIKFLRG